jgi:hypothetical protein
LRQSVVGSMPTRTLGSGGVSGTVIGARGGHGISRGGCAMWAGQSVCAAAVQTLAGGGWRQRQRRTQPTSCVAAPSLPARRWIMTWRPAACGQPRKSSLPPWCVWGHSEDLLVCFNYRSHICRRCVYGRGLLSLCPTCCLMPRCPCLCCRWAAATLLQGEKAAQNFLSEAVVRSLPRGLSLEQRQQVMASTPLSPTLNLLSSMPLVRHAQPCAPALDLDTFCMLCCL